MNDADQTKALELAPPQQAVARQLSVEAQGHIDDWRAMQYTAKLLAKSGVFADIRGVDEETSIAKAVVKIAIGRDYGFSAAESMQHIELIQGRPSIAAHARAAKMKAAGYHWKFIKFNESECHIEVYAPDGEVLGDSRFTIEDAKRMNLAGKDNWKNFPRNMLYCRAIANAQRWYAPEVLSASLASKEEVIDGQYTVIDSGEDRPQRPAPERGTLSLDSLKPSADPNRGHDATAPVVEVADQATAQAAVAGAQPEPARRGRPRKQEQAPMADTTTAAPQVAHGDPAAENAAMPAPVPPAPQAPPDTDDFF